MPDPRIFPEHADPAQAPLLELAKASLAAMSAARADEADSQLTGALVERLRAGDGAQLAALFGAAPSAVIARHVWRRLQVAWTDAAQAAADAGVAATLFALPIIIVIGHESELAPAELTGLLPDSARVTSILREHRALAGNQTFGFANALVASDALDIPRLPALLAWQQLSGTVTSADRIFLPASMPVVRGAETAYLRFLVGTALAAARCNLLADTKAAGWGIPLAQELARQLAVPGLSVLALPRAPQAPLAALQSGRVAQREVAAQLFVTNAIRRLRASVGEPTAVISAHRCATATGGGELRLSLSSPFDARQAEGFRCPLFPIERVDDVVTTLRDLLHDCRVTGVHVLDGVHADRDQATGLTLLFKSDAIPRTENTRLH